MTCNNCKDPACFVNELSANERSALREGNAIAYNVASRVLKDAVAACRARTGKPDAAAECLARLAAIEARQDRIEAILIAKGYAL